MRSDFSLNSNKVEKTRMESDEESNTPPSMH